MDHHLKVMLLPEIPFYIVDQVMRFQSVHAGVKFNMQRSELVPRPVIMNQEIMHAHIRSCVKEGLHSDEPNEKLEEALNLMDRMIQN